MNPTTEIQHNKMFKYPLLKAICYMPINPDLIVQLVGINYLEKQGKDRHIKML